MENPNNEGLQNDPNRNPDDIPKTPITNQDETEFENPSTDPGFEPSSPVDETEKEDDTSIDIDQDALNYKNDRDNGTYNPNII